MKSPSDYCVFILTHGRPEKVITFNTLRKSGYTGPIYLVVDNEDNCARDYIAKFGADNVVIFDKRETAKHFDEFDNFNDRRTIVYARNECFQIAKKLGYKYFIQLDDDYETFAYRMCSLDEIDKYGSWVCIGNRNQNGVTFNKMINATFTLFKVIDCKSFAFSQGGDWMQKFDGTLAFSRRKAMNTFFCATDRQFDFLGRINEDVNTYTWYQSQGNLFLTIPLIQIKQKQTQTNKGGMSDVYLNQGTYIKSFYTIMCSPSCVKIKIMGSSNRRMHHKVEWDYAVPMLIDDRHRKGPRKVLAKGPPTRPTKSMTALEISSLVKLPTKLESTAKASEKRDLKDKKEFNQDYWKDRGFCGTQKLTDSIDL